MDDVDCRLGRKAGLVSIIIPTYNRRSLLEEAINSCLNQTYARIEIIVIDDGSTDDTLEYLQGLQKELTKEIFIHLHQINSGPSSARNKGLDVAVGEYVKFLDSDDTMDLDSIELYMKALTENKADLCLGAKRTMSPEGHKWPINYEPPKGVIADPLRKFFQLTLRPQGALWFFKHKLFDSIRWNESLLAREDTELLSRMLLSKVTVCGAPEAVYNQRYHWQGRQMEKQFNPEVLGSIINSYEAIMELLLEKGAGRPVRRAYAASMSRTALRLWTEDRNSAQRLYNIAKQAFLWPELVLLKTYPLYIRCMAYTLWIIGGLKVCGHIWELYAKHKSTGSAEK